MAIELNHTVVPARDKVASAKAIDLDPYFRRIGYTGSARQRSKRCAPSTSGHPELIVAKRVAAILSRLGRDQPPQNCGKR